MLFTGQSRVPSSQPQVQEVKNCIRETDQGRHQSAPFDESESEVVKMMKMDKNICSAIATCISDAVCLQCILCIKGRLQKTSQELQILSSVTIDCQVTKIVMKPGSLLSVL